MLVAIGLVVAACTDPTVATTSITVAPPSPGVTTTTSSSGSATLLGQFPSLEIGVGDEDWMVAWASTPALRAQGLMGVTDLGDLDGMLFTWKTDSTSGFWMKDTPLPLDIAFFRSDGSLTDMLTMTPCESDECPRYRPSGPYRYALEAPTGRLAAIPRLVLSLPEGWDG